MTDQTLKQLRDAGSIITASDLTADALAYIEADPDGVPESLAANLGSLLAGFYKIAPSVTSDDLTVAIQHLDGSDPSSTNPLAFKIGDSWHLLDAAASFTLTAGTNWFNAGSAELAANDIDFFLYAIAETGASAGLKFGASRISYAVTMNDFSSTSTDEKHIAGNYTNFNSTDEVALIGRFRAQLAASAGFEWSIPTPLVINRPIYETDFLTWVPQFGSNEFTVDPTYTARYKLNREVLYVAFSGITDGTAGTATTFTITVPFLSKNVASHFQYSALPWFNDNNSTTGVPGTVFTTPNSRVLTLRKNDMGTWTASVAGKNAAFTIFMEIN